MVVVVAVAIVAEVATGEEYWTKGTVSHLSADSSNAGCGVSEMKAYCPLDCCTLDTLDWAHGQWERLANG